MKEIVYIVRIFGWNKDQINDDILHKWDFGSEFYEDVDSAIKRKEDICSRIEAGYTEFIFGDKLCYLKPIHPYTRVDADRVYCSTSTYIYDGGYSQVSISFEPMQNQTITVHMETRK